MKMHPSISTPKQNDFLAIENSPITYWFSNALIDLLTSETNIGSRSYVRQGICTTNNVRFLRWFWEAPKNTLSSRWVLFAKGGGVRRWTGFDQSIIDWFENGVRVKSYQEDTPGTIHWSGRMPAQHYLFKPGWTFTRVSRGTLAVREIVPNSLFGHTSPAAIVFNDKDYHLIGFWLNTRIFTYLLRSITQTMSSQEGYVQNLPMPSNLIGGSPEPLNEYAIFCSRALNLHQVCEWFFDLNYRSRIHSTSEDFLVSSHYALIESYREWLSIKSLGLVSVDMEFVFGELGYPAGFHPLIISYDTLPELPSDLNLPLLPQEVLDYLAAHQRIMLPPAELQRIKQRLRGLYEAGPGVKESEEATEAAEGGEGDEDVAVSGAHIPIPTETFLEELSVKLEIHPISVYWLLEELRAEGARCKPEEQRLLEDRLSVLILRLLGHRWPKQIEAGEPVPAWADEDGIIPLTAGVGQPTIAERLRLRLREEDGATGAQQAEALLAELTGLSLEEWLRREFFKRHMRQFKYRPIAWHLASDPAVAAGGKGRGKGKGRTLPAFECLVYYHACSSDVLARIRTQYVEPLLRAERQRLDAARRSNQETEGAQAQTRIQELEEFNRRLQSVAEQGFATPELEKSLADEPLDRWSSDGLIALPSREDLLRQEKSWRVDLNDGVRVNIASIQQAGLLIADVLKSADAKKAIADRARWRSDERRWVRQGKLPRCGWMPDDIPESPQWSALAPQREAERLKLEEKRRAVAERGGQEVATE